jgi:RNA polymerase sigma-54 factor
MVLAPRIEIKQSQKLMMNPQMQQAIQLLQLTNVELRDMLAREMEQNPFLAFDAQHYREAGGATEGKPDAAQKQRAVTVQGTSGVGLGADVVAVRVDFSASEPSDTVQRLEQTLADTPSLSAHLIGQIGEEVKSRAQAALALELVGWLDDDGYLRESDAEICAALEVEPSLLSQVLAQVQGFTPVGVFARNLADGLRLQLLAQDGLTPTHAALLENLDLLGRGDLAALAKAAQISPEALPPYLQTIRALDPRPAASFDGQDVGVAQPDIVVLEGESGWQAYLNEASLPSVLVLERDWEEMATRKITDDERKFMKANVQSARWLQKATQQRAATLLRVARAVIGHQQGFLNHGMMALEPLVLRDIAEVLELHESTVSRSANGKLVQTPKGVFYLKDLFSTALTSKSDTAGSGARGRNSKTVSAAAIKARVAQAVSEEIAHVAPLSDEALVALLAEAGIAVARRTVAKYRKSLHIGSSAQRKRAAKIARAAGKPEAKSEAKPS